MRPLAEITQRLAQGPGLWVCVDAAQGSVPREQGAWMMVFPDAVVGTIGGGHLELQAIGEARARLAGAAGEPVLRYPLGPALGQCCGGVVFLRYAQVTAGDLAWLAPRLRSAPQPVALFGGGHVGKAIVAVLGTLPFDVTWIDSRDEIFPAQVPDNVSCEHSDPVQAAVAQLAPHSRVLVMSFSHAEDLDIVAACLKRLRERGDLPYVGLIGSKTKWATFRHRLEERGFREEELAQVTCPIGVPGITGKEPEVIAVAVAAQLLQTPLPPAP
ncbi:MAG: xanthine dehydrogenase accessory protein XdhC [Ramlibacter sp.]